MKRFSDFATSRINLTGEKIKIEEVIDKEIEIIAFALNDSKYEEGTKVLKLQFKLNEEVRVLFTGSSVLIDQVAYQLCPQKINLV